MADECILVHMEKALAAGVTRAEILEACEVAIAMGGGPAMAYVAGPEVSGAGRVISHIGLTDESPPGTYVQTGSVAKRISRSGPSHLRSVFTLYCSHV